MAFSCVTRNVFSILPLLLILSIIPFSSSFSSSDKVTKELLDHLCAQPTIDSKFCVEQISYEKTVDLDLSGLVDMVLQKTIELGNTNLLSMKVLVTTTTTDPFLKGTYEICGIDYELAITAIKGAQSFVRSKSYGLVHQAVSKALDIVSSCQADVKDLKTVPDYVTLNNSWFEKMCNIDSVFSKVLTS